MGSPNRFSSLLASSTMIFVIVALFLVAAAIAERVAEASADPGYHGYHGYGYGHHGYDGYGHHGFYGHHHGKREAEAAPEADADAYYGHLGYAHHGYGHLGYAHHGYAAYAPYAHAYGYYGYP